MTTVAATSHRRTLKPWTLPLAALLLAAVVALPPLIGIQRFHRRIADSIGQGIGRPVRMASVKMRLLPRPGFQIADFEVEEDPAFGAEPILRAPEVTAYLRLLPLWRGRLEIARIAFDQPSVNLVRNPEGRWNFQSLVSQAARIPKAPTGQTHAGSLPRFPYIDASDARINFKFGDEKMPFSFFNADLALWLQNPGEWRVEFAAQPVRTDLSLDLANTGLVNIIGSLRQAPTLTQMPAVLHAEWTNAPLGQLSRLLAGSDANWRGYADFSADVAASADHASVKVEANGRDLHRIEFEPSEPLNLHVACKAQFARLGRSFDGIACITPTGDGHLLLTGSVHANQSRPDPSLSLELNNTPVAMVLEGLRLVRSGFAPAAKATGRVDGNFTYATTPGSPTPRLHGAATVNGAAISWPSLPKPLALPVLRLAMNTDAAALPKRRTPGSRRNVAAAPVQEPALLLEPFALGAAGSVSVSGAFTRNGFRVHADGESSIEQALALGEALRLVRGGEISFGPKGTAYADLTVHGTWMKPVGMDGALTVRNAEATASFLAQPVEIVAAQAVFAEGRTSWNASALSYGPIHADGSLTYPAVCQPAAACPPRFTLHLASLDAETAQSALLGAARHGELVQSLIDRFGSDKRAWPAMSGTVAVGALTIGTLTVRDVDAAVKVDGATVDVDSLTGDALDGSLTATGTMSAVGNAPQYVIDATLRRASASAMAALFSEKWGGGAVDFTTHAKFSGFQAQRLLASATGTFHCDWSKGGLPAPPEKAGAFPLAHFDRWTADGAIAKNALSLEKSQVLSGKTATALTGTINFARELDLTGAAGSGNLVRIAGTLAAPLATKASPATR